MPKPTCFWCNREIEDGELVMGPVKIRRKGHGTTRDVWDYNDERETEWEEEIEEKRPFHRECLQSYKGQAQEGCLTVLILWLVAGAGLSYALWHVVA